MKKKKRKKRKESEYVRDFQRKNTLGTFNSAVFSEL